MNLVPNFKYILHGASGALQRAQQSAGRAVSNVITGTLNFNAKRTGNTIDDLANERKKKLYGDLL